MDELAAAAGKDPLAFRLALLGKSERERAAGVLKLAAEKAGWGRPRRAGVAQGIAMHHSFESFVAQVAEVSMKNGKVKVERVVCAVDCGVAVNPDVIRAQMEGGIGFALGALYYGEIEIKGGRAAQRNFDTYRSLRIQEMPEVEVHIVPSTRSAHRRRRARRAAARAGGGQCRRPARRAARPPAAAHARRAGRDLRLSRSSAGPALRHSRAVDDRREPAMDRPAPASVFPGQLAWENEGTSRIPFMSYTSEALHRLELERFFYRKHWCYVGLEAEIPNPGDFRLSVVGERSVILARDLEGGVNVVENVCAHRGMSFCRERQRQPARLHLPVPPVELFAQGRPAGRAVSPRRAPGRQDQRRHAGRLQARGERPQQAPGGDPRRRRLRLVRSGRRAARGLPRPGGAALLRPPVRRPRAEDPRLQPAAHPGQLEADAGEHQGPVSPGPLAHLVRDLRPLARRQQVAAGDGRAASPRRHDLDPRPDGQGRAGHRGVELQGRHEARGSALPRHRARALVGRADRGDDHGVPERHLPAAGELGVDPAHPARRPRRLRLHLDPLRLRRRQRGDGAAAAAPGQPVRPGRLRLGRRRRGDRAVAEGLRAEALSTAPWPSSAARTSPMPTTWSPRR